MRFDYAIIGAGSAGRTAAETLVEADSGSSILLIDEEAYLPYKRTQVSKKASTVIEKEDFAVQELSWYERNAVTLETGCTVEQVDCRARLLSTDRGKY